MQKRIIGLVVASVATLVVVSGTAAEASRLVTGRGVKNSSLTGKDVKDGTLTLKDFKVSERAKLRGPAGAPGAPGANAYVNTVVVESPVVTVDAYDIGTVIAYCPAGTEVTGGGYFSSIAIAASSTPNGNVNAWGAVINNSNNDIPVEVNAYAVCA